MKLRHILWLLIFSSCAVGPDYERPELPLPQRYSALSDIAESPGGAADNETQDYRRWWETFRDPVLNELIDEALQSNLDFRLAEARVREARALYSATFSLLFPDLDTVASAERSKSSRNANFNPSSNVQGDGDTASSSGRDRNLFQAGFDAAWELDIFGVNLRQIEAAQYRYESQQEAQRAVLITLLSEVARSYIAVRGIQNQLAIVRRNVEAEKETVDLEKMKLKAGITNDLTVAQAESQLASTAAQAPLLDASLHQSVYRLSILLGQPPGVLQEKLSAPATLPRATGMVPAGFPADLILRRPDVRQAERALAAATANIGVATAELFPKVNLTGTIGLRSEKSNSLQEKNSVYYSVGSVLSWPIFEIRPILLNISIQNLRLEQALILYRQAVLSSLEEVENALIAHDREKARNEMLARSVEASRRAYELAKQLNDAGVVDFLNVLTAQATLHLAEDQLARSDQTLSTTVIALYKALGGGWEDVVPAR